jgi:hypothetical protein
MGPCWMVCLMTSIVPNLISDAGRYKQSYEQTEHTPNRTVTYVIFS